MFTLIGFSEDCAAIDTIYTLDSIADDHVKNEGDAIVVPELNNLIGAYAVGADIYGVQIISPSLRRIALMDMSPVENGATPAFPPDPFFMPANGIELDIDEELTVQGGIDSGTPPIRASVLCFLADKTVQQVSGKIHTIKATVTGTITAYSWGQVTVTLSQSLPVGNYMLVGARFESSVAIAFRFVFIGGIWRPGSIAVADKSAKDPSYARRGQLGSWGKFSHNREPGLEVLSSTTAGAGTLYMDLVKI